MSKNIWCSISETRATCGLTCSTCMYNTYDADTAEVLLHFCFKPGVVGNYPQKFAYQRKAKSIYERMTDDERRSYTVGRRNFWGYVSE